MGTESSSAHDGAGAEDGIAVDGHYISCDPQSYRVTVQCTGPGGAACPAPRDIEGAPFDPEGPPPPEAARRSVEDAWSHFWTRTALRPTVAGPIHVKVALTGPGGKHHVREARYDVVSPTSVMVTKRISSSRPLLNIAVWYDGQRVETTAVRVNGTPVPRQLADLAALFPDRALEGGRVRDGAYELAIEIGDIREKVTVQAVSPLALVVE